MQRARSPYLGKSAYLLLLLLALNTFSYCAETEDPIRNGGGARPLAIGKAVTAGLDDINAAFYNPAGLAGLKSPQFMGMYYTKVFGNYHYFVSAGATRTDYGVVGVGFISSGIDQIPVTTTGTDASYAEYTDNLIFISYADDLRTLNPVFNNVYCGTNIKFFSKGTTGSIAYNATGWNMDLGLKYLPYWWLSLGVNKQNILGGDIVWNTGNSDSYPSPTFIGAAIKDPSNHDTYNFDIEFPSAVSEPTLFHAGVERTMNKYFQLRFGMDQMHDSGMDKTFWNPAIGVGLVLKGLTIDYTYHPYYEDPGNTSHYISLQFNGAYESNIRMTAGSKDKKNFNAGERVDVSIFVPYESNKVVVNAPNDETVNLTYDPNIRSWYGNWVIPSGFKPSAYNFHAEIFDLEGRLESISSNDIYIKEVSAPVAIATPEVPTMNERRVVALLIDKFLGRNVDLNSTIKRKEMAFIIAQAMDYPVTEEASIIYANFSDLIVPSLEARYIEACYNKGAIIGYTDKTYRPEKNFPLIDLQTMLSRSGVDESIKKTILEYQMAGDKWKLLTFDDLIDVFIAAGYLKGKYPLVLPAGTVLVK